MKCILHDVMRHHSHVSDKVVVVFQSSVNLLENVPGSYSETCLRKIEVIHIKVEEVTDMQEEEEEEEDPVSVGFPEIKTEHEVSFVSLCLLLGHISQIYRTAYFLFFFHMKHICCGECYFKETFTYVSVLF